MSSAQIKHLLSQVPPGALVVWDEAYYEYAIATPGYADCLALLKQSQSPWLLLRTLSKAYGLAGLRFGYGVASDPRLAELMDKVRTPFNINYFAQCAASAALSDPAHMIESVEHAVRERDRMSASLAAMGYTPARSFANFLFFHTKEDAGSLAERLLAKGVIVKPWREPQYTRYMRVSVGSTEDNDLFISALAQTRNRDA